MECTNFEGSGPWCLRLKSKLIWPILRIDVIILHCFVAWNSATHLISVTRTCRSFCLHFRIVFLRTLLNRFVRAARQAISITTDTVFLTPSDVMTAFGVITNGLLFPLLFSRSYIAHDMSNTARSETPDFWWRCTPFMLLLLAIAFVNRLQYVVGNVGGCSCDKTDPNRRSKAIRLSKALLKSLFGPPNHLCLFSSLARSIFRRQC